MLLPYRFGRYTLVEKIACGGTAEVYRAVLNAHNGFAKTVALKRLLPSWGGNEEIQEMLVDEARVLTYLQHQAIVQVLELGSEEGITFIAMEFVDGVNCATLLKKIIRDRSPLPLTHALQITGQVLLALEFAHRCEDSVGRPLGIVHRDISPSNILLSYNGEVKITDFGVAKGLHKSSLSTFGQLKGKYAYMAPEQARGEPVDARADLFACGVVLYELLTAKRLFDAATDLEVLEKVKHAMIPKESTIELPPPIRSIVLRALLRDRSARYQSAAQMVADVRHAARKMDALGSSLELASYLKKVFPLQKRCEGQRLPATGHETTKALGDWMPPNRHRAHLGLLGRTLSIALLLAVVAPVSPSKVRQEPLNALPKKTVAALAPIATVIKKCTPLRNASLSVQARPWGKVTVAGYAKRRETPVNRLKVKPGAHLVQVFHPPTDRTVQKWVRLSEGQAQRCLATFGQNSRLTCR